jgi:hypothetical protein
VTFNERYNQTQRQANQFEKGFYTVFFLSKPVAVKDIESQFGIDDFGYEMLRNQIAEHFHISPVEVGEMDSWTFDMAAAYMSAHNKNMKRLHDQQARKGKSGKGKRR